MDFVYIALIIFLLLAIFVPFSMIATSRMLRPKGNLNKTKTINYESAEVPIGAQRDITSNYLPYFPIFITFELVGIVAIVWSFSFLSLNTAQNTYMIMILLASTLLSIASTKMIINSF